MIRVLIGAFIGGALGFAIGYFGKCASGTCPFTNNPVISALIGIAIGIMVSSKP